MMLSASCLPMKTSGKSTLLAYTLGIGYTCDACYRVSAGAEQRLRGPAASRSHMWRVTDQLPLLFIPQPFVDVDCTPGTASTWEQSRMCYVLPSVKDQRGGHSRHINSDPGRISACKASF